MKEQRPLIKRMTYDLSRRFARLVGRLMFRIEYRGIENWPDEGAALVCSNHQSFMDPVLVGLTCHRQLNYLARESLFRFAPFRWLIQWYNAIPIQRDGIGIGGIKETLRRLKRGEMVLIFPEGTRTADGTLQPLQPGILSIARRGKAALIPVAMDGAFQAWPRSQKLPSRGRIHIEIGVPLRPEDFAEMNDEELLAELNRRIETCFLSVSASRSL